MKNKDILISVQKYLTDVLLINDEYEFDDHHIELLYKAIKRFRMSRDKYDKVGYILFNHIFDENILSQIKTRIGLFEGVLISHKLKNYVGHEVLLNLMHFIYSKENNN